MSHQNMSVEKIPCAVCGALILPATAEKTGGKCMPCFGGYRASMEAARKAAEEERIFRESPQGRFWDRLVRQVALADEAFAKLPVPCQRYFAVTILKGEVFNGGFEQYFANSFSETYGVAIDGLREMDADDWLHVVYRAKSLVFGFDPVPTSRDARYAYIERLSDEAGMALDDLDRNLDYDDLNERLRLYGEKYRLW